MSWRTSPVALLFLLGAALLALAFGLVHALGLREYTTVLSGTRPPGAGDGAESAAALYLLAWFGWTLGVPILVIGALVSAALERLGASAPTSLGGDPQLP